MTLDVVLDLLVCPHCGSGFVRSGSTVRCSTGHAYDVARQGHLNLLGAGQPRNADTAAMIEARMEVHRSGVLDAITEALGDEDLPDDAVIIDCGAGPGLQLCTLVDAGSRRGLALDVSVPACRRAARIHPRIGAVVADTWRRLPITDGCADVLLCSFAPRNGSEFARVLAPTGAVITVTPLAGHLDELRTPLGLLVVDPAKDRRLDDALAEHLERVDDHEVISNRPWSRDLARAAIMMGPNAFHADTAALDRQLAGLTWPLPVTVACRITRWRRRP